jgi:hypothetical protein
MSEATGEEIQDLIRRVTRMEDLMAKVEDDWNQEELEQLPSSPSTVINGVEEAKESLQKGLNQGTWEEEDIFTAFKFIEQKEELMADIVERLARRDIEVIQDEIADMANFNAEKARKASFGDLVD